MLNTSFGDEVKRIIEDYEDECVVVFNLGVNGNGRPQVNGKRLMKAYRKLMKEFPEVPWFVESVNPTTVKSGSYKNKNVVKVNMVLKALAGGRYLDCYGYIMENDLLKGRMKDKIHYKWGLSRKILDFVRMQVEVVG